MASQRSFKELLSALALMLAAICVTLGVAEFALRLAYPSGYYIWKPHMSRSFQAAAGVMPGVSGEARFRTNADGLRADERAAADAYRMLTLGGSTTECLYLDQDEAWPQLVQASLNRVPAAPHTWVGNAGMSGRNSRHHVLAMRHLPLEAMKIDTVLLMAGINDLSLRLSQDADYDPQALQRPAAEARLLAETFTGMGRGDPRGPWFKRTVLWQLLRGLRARFAPAPVAGAQDQAGTVYQSWRINRRNAGRLLPHLPDLSSGLDEYARNLKELAAIARAKSVRLIFVTQPTLWRAGLPSELQSLLWFGGVGDFQNRPGQPYYTVEALADGIQRYNDTMMQVCASERLECIDLSTLRKDTSVFYDDVHFNEAGARQVAQIVAEHLKTRPPFAAR